MRLFGSVLRTTRSTRSTRSRRAVALIAALVALIGLGAATAGTASAASTPVHVRITVPMHVVGFNAAVARAHGYVVKTAADGQQYAVAKGSTAQPEVTVPGNCGTATMDYTATGGKAATVYTGFKVDDGAWLFSWNVSVVDDAGVGNDSWGTYLDSDHQWFVTWDTHHSVTGYSYAVVTSGAAFLDNGTTCEAAEVSDATTLY